MKPLELSDSESSLYWFIKGHLKDRKWETLVELVKKAYGLYGSYADECDLVGYVNAYISSLWEKTFKHVPDELKWNMVRDVFKNELPTNNIFVGGKSFGVFPSPNVAAFTETELIKARILAMISTIRLMDAKYFAPKALYLFL